MDEAPRAAIMGPVDDLQAIDEATSFIEDVLEVLAAARPSEAATPERGTACDLPSRMGKE